MNEFLSMLKFFATQMLKPAWLGPSQLCLYDQYT